MNSIPGYISPENRNEVDKLMKPYREAKTKEERDNAREDINRQVTEDTQKVNDVLN